ncbi:MFS general substrate transporter [Ceraceosorus guamensis]|uniref:MFS general substrate transporter n=1 Tax=Ceraceosorus guamensis TaxID=1522189 RepID=A0A316W769_9BASI|nr:MFS general substrate transporter [Ceraceosorus guamensis]PWN43903.1 MFS general substrate transporter [Ceraceosorus guamensis]
MAKETGDGQVYFPEGGHRAWLTIAGSWCCSFITFGLANSFGVYQEYYARNFLLDKSSSQIAWIGAFQYAGIFSSGIFAGRAFDVGMYRPLLTIGMVILIISQFLLSLCREYYQFFLAQGVGLGLGFGIVFNLSVAVPSHWFSKRRATAMGILASGSSAGGICLPIMLTKLQDPSSIGYAWAQRVVGFLALALLLFAWFTMPTRLPPTQSYKNGGWRRISFFELQHFKQPAYACFVLGAMLILFGLYTPFTYMDVATRTYDIPASGYWLSVLNAGSVFGRVLPGFVADRFGRMNTILPHLIMSSILVFVFPLAIKSLAGLIPFAILYGYSSGCYVSLIPSAIGQLGSTSTFGTRLGMCFFVCSLGGLFGTPASGALLGSAAPFDWWASAGFAGACVTAGTLLMIVSRTLALKGRVKGRI